MIMASLGIVRSTFPTKGREEYTMEDISPSPAMGLAEAWAKIIEIVDRFPQQEPMPRAFSCAGATAAATQTYPQSSTSNHSAEDSSGTLPLLVSLMSVLREGGMVDVLRAYVLSVLDKKVKDEVAPRFWALLAPESSGGCHEQQEQKQQKQHHNTHNKEREDDQHQDGISVAGETNEPAVLEDTVSETELPPRTRREAYVRVKRALVYVAKEVDCHLSLVRMLDLASAASASGSTRSSEKYMKAVYGGRISTSCFSSCPSREETIEARYRCAFTAQVMAGARGDFHGIMRAFFDRNLRFWHRGWLEERRRRQQEGREQRWSQGEVLSVAEDSVRFEDNMNVSDDDGKEEEDGEGDGEDQEEAMGTMEELPDASDEDDTVDRDKSAAMMEEGCEARKEDGEQDEQEMEDADEEGLEMEEEDSEEEIEQEQEDNEGDDFADMSKEELLELWGVLIRLGWFSLLQDAFSGVVSSHVLAYVRSRCDGVYEVPVLDHVMAWKDQVLLRWIALLLHGGDERYEQGYGHVAVSPAANTTPNADEGDIEDKGNQSVCAALGDGPMSSSFSGKGADGREGNMAREDGGSVDPAFGWAQRLGLAVHEAFCSARIAELFDIIADYPDSAVAIGELKTALGVTQQHQRLAVLLRENVRRRLLHPGANTLQIIDVYIATIKVLRILDPKDVLLETVAGPVRRYLRARKDTVRCIVASLTDETSGDLYEELRRQDARPLDRDDGSDEDDDGPVAPNWEPASRDADPTSGNRSGSDILTMLVSIYGSKELFVTEYRLMLADKLVNNLAYDTDREVQNLELLKLRFGESSMHHCEIMVRDVEESKRVNANVQEWLGDRSGVPGQKEETSCLDAVMVSQHFWPHLLGDDMRLHPSMQRRLEEFSKAYSVIKNPRLLVWKKQLGVVQITLEFGGVERSFSVSPLHATLIMHFEGKSEKTWSLSDLAREVALPPSVVQKKMMLWVNQGVVAESPGPKYRLIRNQAQARPGSEGVDAMAMEDSTEAAVSADANDKESDKVIEQFLTGMLTNLNKLPLNRIHNSLKMFMSGGDNKYEKSLPELQQLLWRLCSEGRLEQVDGEYRLVKQ